MSTHTSKVPKSCPSILLFLLTKLGSSSFGKTRGTCSITGIESSYKQNKVLQHIVLAKQFSTKQETLSNYHLCNFLMSIPSGPAPMLQISRLPITLISCHSSFLTCLLHCLSMLSDLSIIQLHNQIKHSTINL